MDMGGIPSKCERPVESACRKIVVFQFTQARSKFQEVILEYPRSVVLHLVMILRICEVPAPLPPPKNAPCTLIAASALSGV